MAKKRKQAGKPGTERPQRAKLSPKESLKRLREFAARKEQFAAAVRKGQDRGLSA